MLLTCTTSVIDIVAFKLDGYGSKSMWFCQESSDTFHMVIHKTMLENLSTPCSNNYLRDLGTLFIWLCPNHSTIMKVIDEISTINNQFIPFLLHHIYLLFKLFVGEPLVCRDKCQKPTLLFLIFFLPLNMSGWILETVLLQVKVGYVGKSSGVG